MKFLSYENLLLAYKNARKSRKDKQEVYLFDLNMEEKIFKMFEDIKQKRYIHWKYNKIILVDSKKRYIHSPNFRDHILHHMMYNCLYDLVDKKLIFSTFACRKGFWSHKAILYMKKQIKKEEKKWEKLYYLKLDISKYFYSINHKILQEKLFSYIEDEDLKYAIKIFLESYTTENIFDNLFDSRSHYILEQNKWIPIWSIISQLFANFYLNSFDHFVKRELKIKNYFRYMDDFVFVWTKDKLQGCFEKIINFLTNELFLQINPKKISFNLVSDWISFVWYKIKNWKVFVWKRIIKWIQKFVSKVKSFNWIDDEYILKRLKNVWESRRGFFDLADFWESYIKKLDLKWWK